MDELFEAMTLIQTQKIGKFPIVLIGRDFWDGLFDWIREIMLKGNLNISEEDLDLILLTDSADECVAHINNFYSKYLLSPNF
jgi:predicted Rossmann-fold nucleotide-binding protein